MFKKIRFKRATARLFEEKLFEVAMVEVESGQRRQGLWSKAISESDGNSDRAESIYLKLRVRSLKDEILISSTMDEWLAARERSATPKSETPPIDDADPPFLEKNWGKDLTGSVQNKESKTYRNDAERDGWL